MSTIISAGTTTGSGFAVTPDTSGNLAFQTQAGANTITVPNSTGTILTTGTSGRCAAWVQFNSSGTVIGSYNVTSVTYVGTGVYSINFTTAFANTNYCPIISSAFASGVTENVVGTVYNDAPYAPTTSVLTLVYHNGGSGARLNPTFGYVAVFA